MALSLVVPFGTTDRLARGAAPLVDSWAGGDTNEERAEAPEIFVGWVIARDGEVDIAEPGSGSFVIPVYTVDIETTLKGEAKGQIRLGVLKTPFTPEYQGGPVEIGGRYLFAAIGPDATVPAYTIGEGMDNLPIANDEEAAAVIAEFERLIADAERRLATPEPEETDPCETLTESPTIDLEPNEGRAGSRVRATASNLVRPEVGIWWSDREKRIGRGRVRDDCTMSKLVTLPKDADPGWYEIIVIDGRAERAGERFRVIE